MNNPNREVVGGVPLVSVIGTPRTMGEHLGSRLKSRLQVLTQYLADQLCSHARPAGHQLTPEKLRDAVRPALPMLQRHEPSLWMELEAMGHASELPLEDLLLVQGYGDLLSYLGCQAPPQPSTYICIDNTHTQDGTPLLALVWYLDPALFPYLTLLRRIPTHGPATLSLTLAGLGPVAGGLSTLALVEGGLLLGDDDLRLRAEGCLVALDRGLPMQPGANGLGGFPLLALETAQQGGMRVPGRLLQQARKQIARALPAQEAADAGRLGLAAFARAIYGLGDASSAQQQVRRLGELAGTLAGERPDPLGWFFATLAMREAGGDAWNAWSAATASALTPLLHADAQTAAGRVDPQAIRHGDSAGERADVFATSLVLLNLQAPYRYLPLAPTAK